jgi:hypothetical protein
MVEAMRTKNDIEIEELQDKNASDAYEQIKNSKHKNKTKA